jgi:hypothetical protein
MSSKKRKNSRGSLAELELYELAQDLKYRNGLAVQENRFFP